MSNQDRFTQKVNAGVIEAIKKAIEAEKHYREKFGINESFKFVPAQLQGLLQRFEALMPEGGVDLDDENKKIELPREKPGHRLVFVYLYNAKGAQIKSWERMLTPKGLYEHGISRPVYFEEEDLHVLFRDKPHQPYYAYLAIFVPEESIIPPPEKYAKDRYGHHLTRLKEGALAVDNIAFFIHNTLGTFIMKDEELVKVEV